MGYYIGIDLGGTNIAAAIVNENHEIVEKDSIKTSMKRGFMGLCEDMSALCKSLVTNYKISFDEIISVGIGCPGMINESTGEIVFSNNLDIYHEALNETMRGLLGKPVYSANDANVAALGEYVAGSGKSVHSMIAITLGTGVGSGIILEGKILGGFNYSGGELGHMVIERNGRQCTCGRKGCFETYASATGIIQSAREGMTEDTSSILWSLANGSVESVTGRMVFEAREQGDPLASQVVEDYIEYLALGLANVVNALQPEMIAVGGGISHQGKWLMEALQEQVNTQVFGRFGDKQTRIVAATLGNDAGIIGAALLGRSLDDI